MTSLFFWKTPSASHSKSNLIGRALVLSSQPQSILSDILNNSNTVFTNSVISYRGYRRIRGTPVVRFEDVFANAAWWFDHHGQAPSALHVLQAPILLQPQTPKVHAPFEVDQRGFEVGRDVRVGSGRLGRRLAASQDGDRFRVTPILRLWRFK